MIKIGSRFDTVKHGIDTLVFDKHGFSSKRATQKLIKQIELIKPDVIGLHNLHGYYLHIGVLFSYLREAHIPVLWTLFDCWAFTGHCTYFDDILCEKWKSTCSKCPKVHKYPRSLFDYSYRNFVQKQSLFNSIRNIELVTHSNWLKSMVENSFLKDLTVHHIPNGVNLDVFKPLVEVKIKIQTSKKIILGVASIWDQRKGLDDFILLNEKIKDQFQIVLIGLNEKQIKRLPSEIIGVRRTESLEELVAYYNAALVFVNPTWQDNFPTTNLEALACGTPVVTYNTGGSPEAIDNKTGRVVKKGEIQELKEAICQISLEKKEELQQKCRERAEQYFDKEKRYQEYLDIYEKLIDEK